MLVDGGFICVGTRNQLGQVRTIFCKTPFVSRRRWTPSYQTNWSLRPRRGRDETAGRESSFPETEPQPEVSVPTRSTGFPCRRSRCGSRLRTRRSPTSTSRWTSTPSTASSRPSGCRRCPCSGPFASRRESRYKILPPLWNCFSLFYSKLVDKGWTLKKKLTIQVCTERGLMPSQWKLKIGRWCHKYNFFSQVNAILGLWSPSWPASRYVFYCKWLKCPTVFKEPWLY